MPITLATNVTYTLTSLNVDLVGGVMTCGFSIFVNGAQINTMSFAVTGAAFASLAATMGDATTTLLSQIEAEIYQYAVSQNLISGAVS